MSRNIITETDDLFLITEDGHFIVTEEGNAIFPGIKITDAHVLQAVHSLRPLGDRTLVLFESVNELRPVGDYAVRLLSEANNTLKHIP